MSCSPGTGSPTPPPWPRPLDIRRNKVDHVHTVGRVAKELRVDEHLIHELTIGLDPEDGVIWVYDVADDDGTLAFTEEGVEELQRLLQQYNRVRPSKS